MKDSPAVFVLLEHDTRAANHEHPAYGPEVHWDFMTALPGTDRLATWRLAQNPLACPKPIPAERIDDHRREYLNYEGEISNRRGRVRRLDRGGAVIKMIEGNQLVASLSGEHLAGRISIEMREGRLVFLRSAENGSSD